MKKPRHPNGTPFPVRLDDAMIARLQLASSRLGINKADSLRLAAGVGLLRLAAIDYDVASAVLWKSEKSEVSRYVRKQTDRRTGRD